MNKKSALDRAIRDIGTGYLPKSDFSQRILNTLVRDDLAYIRFESTLVQWIVRLTQDGLDYGKKRGLIPVEQSEGKIS